MSPLSQSLENQLVTLCSRKAPYRIEALPMDNGHPENLQELLKATARDWRDTNGMLLGQRVPVWSGASDKTIWSSPSVNHLLRAWHDSHHVLLDADMSTAGEKRCAKYACSLITGALERQTLWCELAGQTYYWAEWKAHIDNQRNFVRDCLLHGIAPTVASGLYHNQEVTA
jgi:hypothetical protein